MALSEVVVAFRPDRWNSRLQLWAIDTRNDGSYLSTCWRDGNDSTSRWTSWSYWKIPQYVRHISDIAVVSDSKSLFHLWIVDAENATLYLKEQQNQYNYDEWSDWQSWATPHERVKWIAAVCLADGRLQVWMVDEAGNLWNRQQNTANTPQWSDWTP